MGMGGSKLPSFMNHMESGTVTLDSANTWISIPSIAFPKVILIYNNNFDFLSAKADKPMIGAYGALYIAGSDALTPNSMGYYTIAEGAFYFTNWGSSGNYPNARSSRTESRGVPYFDPTNRRFYFHGFGTGEYDFKRDITYNWIAWD